MEAQKHGENKKGQEGGAEREQEGGGGQGAEAGPEAGAEEVADAKTETMLSLEIARYQVAQDWLRAVLRELRRKHDRVGLGWFRAKGKQWKRLGTIESNNALCNAMREWEEFKEARGGR